MRSRLLLLLLSGIIRTGGSARVRTRLDDGVGSACASYSVTAQGGVAGTHSIQSPPFVCVCVRAGRNATREGA
uniref:Putative secreted protein n=1 Tax=Anopheles triannulatus TaxID=58253 RepID=A0A2M4B7R7_9DIPT